jgi:23S rRNA (cytidine1920-2'-O)/16S rRNA (cytidine1409-2'-O)-methyltransferase
MTARQYRYAMPGVRLDRLLVERGLVETRSRAQALVMAGRVVVDGVVVDKAGTAVSPEADVSLIEPPRYVSRGGEKLEAALAAFGPPIEGAVCADIGASTGGFTDCLLQQGASRVYAVDVGKGLLDSTLRADPRVVVLEGVNARNLSDEQIGEPLDGATVDVAFISLKLIIPALAPLIKDGGWALALVKPQFEVGRGEVGRGGVVRDPAKHRRVLIEVADAARAVGLEAAGVLASPLMGPKGNREFFLYTVKRPGEGLADLAEAVEAAVASFPG